MATRALTVSNPDQFTYGQSYKLFGWTGLLNGDDGSPARLPTNADRSVQVIGGTAGAGLAVILEGSNDPNAGTAPGSVSWFPLKDVGGVAISLTGFTQGAQIRELPLYVRPRVTGGDGTTNVSVNILARSNLR